MQIGVGHRVGRTVGVDDEPRGERGIDLAESQQHASRSDRFGHPAFEFVRPAGIAHQHRQSILPIVVIGLALKRQGFVDHRPRFGKVLRRKSAHGNGWQ